MRIPDSFDSLLAAPHFILLECVAGSTACGLNRPGSDRDIRGVFALPAAAYLGLGAVPNQLSDPRGDTAYFALRRFAELASGANPNMLELLFAPEDCLLRVSSVGRRLLEARTLFLSRACYQSHVAYANAQIRKARGQNKWVNRPQPEDPPRQEDFCWFIARAAASADPPMRPVPVAESGIELEECHAAALEHSLEVYRLYHFGRGARGVFRGGNLVMESIPLAEEGRRFAGLLLFNRQAHEAALRDHRNYWAWRSERNESRWQDQERGALDYDAKNLMHTFRLLLAAESMLREGAPRVRFEGADRDFLLAVRNGSFRYEELIEEAERRTRSLEALLPESPLPEAPDLAAIDDLVRDLTKEWESAHS
ncbi:MAG: nucleotidyltransferase domain-containing protein [Candidatus Sumerlaeia bacterium]|nr:nucleotidyltransferase domain-containing protein [Candidatus Sumerlaeia bacterium]